MLGQPGTLCVWYIKTIIYIIVCIILVNKLITCGCCPNVFVVPSPVPKPPNPVVGGLAPNGVPNVDPVPNVFAPNVFVPNAGAVLPKAGAPVPKAGAVLPKAGVVPKLVPVLPKAPVPKPKNIRTSL